MRSLNPILQILNIAVFKYSWAVIYVLALSIILLGATGLIDKHGPLEHRANLLISNSTGLTMDELEKMEGVKLDD